MKPENYKEILLTMLHSYTLIVRPCYPNGTERELFHRLVDTANLTGHNVFSNRNDSRYFVANVSTANGSERVLTVYNNAQTGKLDLDFDNPLTDPEYFEDFFMILYSILMIAISITVSELVNHTETHQSQLAMTIKARATAANL